jgi:ssDNA-binding Zn-finger/Zn-ribbon topoisomerase 1
MELTEKILCPECNSENIKTEESFRRTTGPKNKPRTRKLISYGYFFNKNTCIDCKHIWEIKK